MNSLERDRVRQYIALMDSFLTDAISAGEFDRKYEPLFLEDEFNFSDEVFFVLDRLFAEADAYCDDATLRDPANGDLGPAELKEACDAARAKLEALCLL